MEDLEAANEVDGQSWIPSAFSSAGYHSCADLADLEDTVQLLNAALATTPAANLGEDPGFAKPSLMVLPTSLPSTRRRTWAKA